MAERNPSTGSPATKLTAFPKPQFGTGEEEIAHLPFKENVIKQRYIVLSN